MNKIAISADEFLKLAQYTTDNSIGTNGLPQNIIANYQITGSCVFEEYISISSNLKIQNCSFEYLEFHSFKTEYSISITESTFEDAIWILNSNFGSFAMWKSSGKKIYIDNSIFKSITWLSLTFKSLLLSNVSILQDILEINRTIDIKEITLEFNANSTGKYIFQDIKLDKLTVRGYNKSCQILFQNISVNNLTFFSFLNESYFIISNISNKTSKSAISFINSTFNKFQISKIDFNKFESIYIFNCSLTEMTTNSIIWPKEIKVESKKDFLSLRETYRQLKHLTIKQGDIIASLEFKSLGMNAYYEELKRTKGRFQDKLILFTNKWSNNHGLSWRRPFLWIMFFNGVFFISITYPYYQFSLLESENWFNTLNDFLQLLNPFHQKIDFRRIPKTSFTNFIDNFSRLVNSYFIFQFLRAFRKYVI